MGRTIDDHRGVKALTLAAAVAATLGCAGLAAADASAMQVDPNHHGCWLPGTKTTAPSPLLGARPLLTAAGVIARGPSSFGRLC